MHHIKKDKLYYYMLQNYTIMIINNGLLAPDFIAVGENIDKKNLLKAKMHSYIDCGIVYL